MKLSERLSNIFFQEGIISDEEREIVQFGLESIGGNLAGIFLTLAVGICYKQIMDAFFLYLFLFPLRKSVGGFHANTKVRCLLMSAAMLGISFTLFSAFEHSEAFYVTCTIVFGFIIWALAPVDNPSKTFDARERNVYRLRSRVVLGVESIILIMAFYFKWGSVIRSVSMAFFIASVSLSMGVLKNALTEKDNQQNNKNLIQTTNYCETIDN